MKKKLKFSFSESRLNKHLAQLKSLNDDFRNLSGQITKLENYKASSAQGPSQRLHADIEKFSNIQKASKKVYEALRTACTKHNQHVAHFPVEAKYCVVDRDSSPHIHFDLAFTHHVSLSGTACPGDPIWFAIKSTINETNSASVVNIESGLVDLTHSLKRQVTMTNDQISGRSKRVKSQN